MLAIALRRPILSSANGGPTAWIDAMGRLRESLENDEEGGVVAEVGSASTTSTYVRWGSFPIGTLSIATWLVAIRGGLARRRHRFKTTEKTTIENAE